MCLLKTISKTSIVAGLAFSICTPNGLLGKYSKELLEKDIKDFYQHPQASSLMRLALDCTYDDTLDNGRFESFLNQLEACGLKGFAQFLREMPSTGPTKTGLSTVKMLPEKTEDEIRDFLSSFEEQEDFKQSGIEISDDLIEELYKYYNEKVRAVNGSSSSKFSNIDKKVHTYMKALSRSRKVMPSEFYDILHFTLRAHLVKFANPKDPNFDDYLIGLNETLNAIFEPCKGKAQKEWDKILKSVSDYKKTSIDMYGLGKVEFIQELGNVFSHSRLDQYTHIKSLLGEFSSEGRLAWVNFRAILSNLIDYEIEFEQKGSNLDEFFKFKTIKELINYLKKEEVSSIVFRTHLHDENAFLDVLKQLDAQEDNFISFMNSLLLAKKQQKQDRGKMFYFESQSKNISETLKVIEEQKRPAEDDQKQKKMRWLFAKKQEQRKPETPEQQKSTLIEAHKKITRAAKNLRKTDRSHEVKFSWMFIFNLVSDHVNL